jgi:predicted polyphosphate/ATP-dependent NAD kinase
MENQSVQSPPQNQHRLHGLPAGIGCSTCSSLLENWRQTNQELLAVREELRLIREAIPDLDERLFRHREYQARAAK